MPSSPARSARRSPPRSPNRKPLAERSDSTTNSQRNSAAPSIRIVADNGPSAYSKNPFQTLPAHVLAPTANYGPRTFSYYQDAPVSDENTPTNATIVPGTDEASLLPLPQFPQSTTGHRASTDTTASSDADTLAHYDSSLSPTLSSRFSQTITTPSTPTLQEDDSQFTKLPQVPDNLSRHSRSTIRLVIPSRSNDVPPLSDKQIESIATGPALQHYNSKVENLQRRNSLPTCKQLEAGQISHPTRHDINLDDKDSAEPQSASTKTKRAPTLGGSSSTDSVVYNDASYSVVKIIRPRSASSPPSTSHASTSGDENVIRYPIIRKQTSSGSWATVTDQPDTDARMNDDDYPRPTVWSSRLSTIPSESEPGSYSLSSGATSPDPTILSPRLRRAIGSIISSEASHDLSHRSASSIGIAVPAPLFTRPRRLPSPPEHDGEGEDTLGELTSPTLQPKRSGYLTKIRGLSRPSSSESMKSQMSFQGDALSWVKRFYSGGEWPTIDSPYTSPSVSTSRLNTATSGTTTSPISDAFPAEIFRPRNRPRGDGDRERDRNRRKLRNQPSAETVDSQARSETTWSDRFRRPIWSSSGWGSGVFSPHLHRDRRNNGGINAWSTPSLEDPTRSPFGPVGRQIVLFCFGFLFPFSWFIAAVLPIPSKPISLDPNAPLEEAMPHRADRNFLRTNPGALVSMERLEKQYVKAHWWRSLNRIMCVVGLLLIGAIIALVILALRMRASR